MKKNKVLSKKQLLEDDIILENKNSVPLHAIKQVLDWLREGKTDKELFLMILEKYGIKESTANKYLATSKAAFKNEMILDKKFNIIQHIKRYDKDISQLLSYQPRTASFSQFNFLKTQAYLDMIMLMQKKEKVLGFHQKRTDIKIKNNFRVYIKPLIKNFSFENLTSTEKKELYFLIEKSKNVEENFFELKPNQNKKIINIDNNLEIEKNIEYTPIEIVIEKDNPIEEEKIRTDTKIIDATNGVMNEKKTLDDVRNKLFNFLQ